MLVKHTPLAGDWDPSSIVPKTWKIFDSDNHFVTIYIKNSFGIEKN
jgi:hypothetical protein